MVGESRVNTNVTLNYSKHGDSTFAFFIMYYCLAPAFRCHTNRNTLANGRMNKPLKSWSLSNKLNVKGSHWELVIR